MPVVDNKNRSDAETQSLEVAEDNREADWKSKSFMASIFMGDLDMAMAFPFPEQQEADRKAGDELLARVAAWAEEHLDGAAIDTAEQIPAHVFAGLNELGLWGIKIPKKYGGLGMSQTNYMRVLSLIGRYCGSTSATLSAHQSIGVPQPLKLFGTEEQKQKFLPRVAAGEISAFALTEPGVGSDPAKMSTTAELSEDGTHWVLSGEKLWCTNGCIADLFVVMARTPDKVIKGKNRRQITAFIVEGDAEGIEVLHRCRFLGIRAIENGLIRFTNVKVPVDNVILGEGQGLKLALTTLNDGRLGIPAIAADTTTMIADFSAQWAKSREQWGRPIGKHEAGSDKLARITAGAYAMSALASWCAAVSDRGDTDIRMEAAAAKMYNTELSWQLIDEGLQFRAGRGFETDESLRARGETPFPIERALRDSRINRIVEGTTDIMHLFLAREALDKHLSMAAGLFQKGGDKVGTLIKCASFYPLWYAKLLFGGFFKSFPGFDPKLAAHLRWIDGRVRTLARKLFHQMALQGPKLETRQLILARVVDAGVELATMSLVAARVQGELNRGSQDNLLTGLYWLKARRQVVDDLIRGINHNVDAEARALATQLMEQAQALPAIETPDSLQARPREFGKELTSGTRTERLPLESEVTPLQDDRAAK